jgi:hypothetical protein
VGSTNLATGVEHAAVSCRRAETTMTKDGVGRSDTALEPDEP